MIDSNIPFEDVFSAFLPSHDINSLRCLRYKKRDRSHRLIHAILKVFFVLTLIVSILGSYQPSSRAASSSDIVEGEVWRYFKGVIEPPSKWNHIGFDDSSWLSGPGSFGYGNGKYNTELVDMPDSYVTVFARREFAVTNPDAVTGMFLSIVSDGAFIAYLNGIEVARSERRLKEPIDISGFAHELLSGNNVLAIQVSNNAVNSGSFFFRSGLEIVEE